MRNFRDFGVLFARSTEEKEKQVIKVNDLTYQRKKYKQIIKKRETVYKSRILKGDTT